MNWEDIARQRERSAMKADAGLKGLWARIQTALWPELDAIIGGMAVDKAGRLTFTLSNMQKAQRVGMKVSAVWKRALGSMVMDFLIGAFKGLLGVNKRYIQAVAPNATEKAEERIMKRLLAFYGYKDGEVIPGTLFDALNPDKGLSAEIARKVQTAIASRQTLANFMNRQGLFFGKLSKKDKSRVENKMRLSELSQRVGRRPESKSKKSVFGGDAWNIGLQTGRTAVRRRKASK